MFQLEKFHGSKSRHACPACGHPRMFARYVKETGEHLAHNVGRCNRESNCGYHFTPKDYFAANPDFAVAGNKSISRQAPNNKNGFQSIYAPRVLTKKVDYIPFECFKSTLDNYDQNDFVQFLFDLFPDCGEEIQDALKKYFVGIYQNYTCFPYIDRFNRICRGKLIRFNRATGKRLKGEFDTSSLVRKLKLKEDFEYSQIFFGEHLLEKYPGSTVAIVEAEKTAIIASLCLPDFIWIATGSKQWLKAERLKGLEHRKIIFYPDSDGFEPWQRIAQEAQKWGITVKVSSLIENNATDEEKANGYDLADYLINEQMQINEYNAFADSYNPKLEKILSDETLLREFEQTFAAQKSNFMLYGNLPAKQAEEKVLLLENVRKIVFNLTERQKLN